MTTAQESTNGHCVLPPPSSVENTAEPTSADLPANQDNNQQFPANAYHVPPKRFAPRPNAYAHDDSFHRPPETEPLPGRCQFMFSDGRQCTMARSDIHPSLCVYHSDREEQLFGDPSSRFETRKLDFPELFSACRDLSTAAGVNRALAQVFRLLAQRRISRQEAATFAKLGHLLLQSIRAARAELADALPDDLGQDEDSGVTPPSGESLFAANVYRQDELRGVNKDHQELSRGRKVITPLLPHEKVILSESALADESKDPSVSRPANANSPEPPTPVPLELPAQRVAMSNSRRISTSAPPPGNSPEISIYKNNELKVSQNQHLQKNWNGV